MQKHPTRTHIVNHQKWLTGISPPPHSKKKPIKNRSWNHTLSQAKAKTQDNKITVFFNFILDFAEI